MENTLVDESQRQSKEYGSASKPRHEKYSGMILGGMVCQDSLLHLLLRCTVHLWSKFVDYSVILVNTTLQMHDGMPTRCWILPVSLFSSGIY